MTDSQYLNVALDFIVSREKDNDYICEKLHDIPEELDICTTDCVSLCRNCVLRFLEHYNEL